MTHLSVALDHVLTSLPGGTGLTGLRDRFEDETGAQTAEYGILTLAAVGFAGLLAVVLTSGEARELLMQLVEEALTRD